MMKNMTLRRKKVKGAVLFTVVAVMAVMIIFMFATLSVVMAIQKRTVSDYSSSQSYYTARSAVDSVLESLRDKNDQNLAKKLYSWTAAGTTQRVEITGLPASMGVITNSTIECTSDTWQKNPAAAALHIYKISATARVGDEESTVSVYIAGDPTAGAGGGGGGGTPFITTGMAGVGTNAPIYGTAIFSLDEPNDILLTNASQLAGSLTCYGNATTGTSDAYYMLGTGDGIVVYNNFNKKYGNLALDNTIAVIGNLNLKVDGANTYQNAGGNLKDRSSSTSLKVVTKEELAKIKKYELKGGMDIVPYIYCDNVLEFGDSDSRVGYSNGSTIYAPVNIYCGSISTLRYNNELKNGINGDIFCYDETATSTFKRTNQNTIIGWIESTLDDDSSDNSIISGNMYTKGNIEITGGNWTVNGNLYVKGNIAVSGGSLTVNGKCNKAGYGTLDDKLTFPATMDTYTADGKEYPGVIEHKTENPDGFIKSYAELHKKTDINTLSGSADSTVESAALLTYANYNSGTKITVNTKFPQKIGSSDVVEVDLRQDKDHFEDVKDIYLYFPDGLSWDDGSGSMTIFNLVDWQYVTDAEGFILDAPKGKRVTDITKAARKTLAASEGDNGKLPVQKYVKDGSNFKPVIAYAKMVIGEAPAGEAPNNVLIYKHKILTEYYATKTGGPIHVQEDGNKYLEMIPTLEIYMKNGTFETQNNPIISAYAKCYNAHFKTGTSGSDTFKKPLYTSMNGATVEVNSKDVNQRYILWIGAFAFKTFTSQNDCGLLFVDPTQTETPSQPPSADYSIWYALEYTNS